MTVKELPPEVLLYHILPRVPARSVLRFKCVSKQWHSFVSTPMFKKMHHHHIINDRLNHRQKLLLLSTTKPYKFSSIDCEAPEDGLTASRCFPFEVINPNSIKILTSFHGLVCVLLKKIEYVDLILWNPLTGEYKTVSTGHAVDYYGASFTLYYSSCDDDYKLLCATYDGNVYIYSLKSESWRNVDSTKDFRQPLLDWVSESQWPCICLNETLYFLDDFWRRTSSLSAYSVIRFDTKTEKFTLIAPPSLADPQSTTCLSFTVVEGCIHLCVAYEKSSMFSCDKIELWRLDGNREWTKVVTYCQQWCSHVLHPPLHVMRNGKLLVYMCSEFGGDIYKLDLEKNSNVITCSYIAHGMNFHPRGIYIESFVSPNRYTK